MAAEGNGAAPWGRCPNGPALPPDAICSITYITKAEGGSDDPQRRPGQRGADLPAASGPDRGGDRRGRAGRGQPVAGHQDARRGLRDQLPHREQGLRPPAPAGPDPAQPQDRRGGDRRRSRTRRSPRSGPRGRGPCWPRPSPGDCRPTRFSKTCRSVLDSFGTTQPEDTP